MKNVKFLSPALIIPVLNIAVVALYLANLEFESDKIQAIGFALIGLSVLAMWGICKPYPLSKLFFNIQVSVLIGLIFMISLEMLTAINPKWVPMQIRFYLKGKNQDDEAIKAAIEKMNMSPYIKFKPNVTVVMSGFRGDSQQFEYSWQTDQYGYKNLDEIASLENVNFIAVGDSMTEGMGVKAEETWASQLSQMGYATYNMGVQGYAPSQILGTYKLNGQLKEHEYLIIGYTASIFTRQKYYFDVDENVLPLEHASLKGSNLNEIRGQANFLTSAIYLFLINRLQNIRAGNISKDSLAKSKQLLNLGFQQMSKNSFLQDRKDLLRLYIKEIATMFYKDKGEEQVRGNDMFWQTTLNDFREIIKLARSNNAKVVLVYFPSRNKIYYEKLLGKPLPEIYFEKIESDALAQFAKEEKIEYLDFSNALIEYVEKIPDNATPEDLPYLEVDGHFSARGNEIIAQRLAVFLKENKQ